MRLLLLSPCAFYPPRHGNGARIYYLARALQPRHTVTVVFFDRAQRLPGAPSPPDLDAIGLPLVEHHPGAWARWFSRFGLLRWSADSLENRAVLREVIASRSIGAVISQDLALAPLLPELGPLPLVWSADGISSELRRPTL